MKDKKVIQVRKQWSWPYGLAEKVYLKVLHWSKNYHNFGMIHKSKRIPHERFGEEMPETLIEMRVHTLTFTHSEIKWLSNILQTEDKDTTQARIFVKAFERFEDMQQKGRAPAGIQLPFDLALTPDEVKYIHMLLDCIRPSPGIKLTPSERKLKAEAEKKGIAGGNW